MGWRALALVAAFGCDGVLGLRPPQLADATSPHVCPPGTPFPTGTPVAINGTWSVEAARFDPAQTLAYLALCTPGDTTKFSCKLYVATFLPATQEFGAYFMLPFATTAEYYAYPTVAPDGSYLLFSLGNNTSVHVQIAMQMNGAFGSSFAPLVLGAPWDSENSNEPYLVGNQTLYLSFGTSDVDLYTMTGPPPAFGGTPEAVPGVNTPSTEIALVPRDDELEIFFASDRDRGGNFNLDIYTATRATTSDPFGPATRLTALSNADINWPVWLSPDGCELYYINKVTQPSSSYDATLYVTRR